MNIDYRLQRTVDIRYIIDTIKTDAGIRILPITENVAQIFQTIMLGEKCTDRKKSIDGYRGFLFYDDN